VSDIIKKEVKHKCPTDMIYSIKAGQCIPKSELETVDGAVDPNSRSKASSPLIFPTVKKRGDIKKI